MPNQTSRMYKQPPAICFPKGKQPKSTGLQLEALMEGAGNTQSPHANSRPRMCTCHCLWHPKPSGQLLLPSWALMEFPAEHTARCPLIEGETGENGLGGGVNALSAIQLQTGNEAANWLIKPRTCFTWPVQGCVKKKKKCWLFKNE